MVSVLGIHTVRVDRTSDVVFLDDDSVVVHKSFGDHEQPAVGEAFCVIVVTVAFETHPGEHLLGCPSAAKSSGTIPKFSTKKHPVLTMDNPTDE